MDVLPVPRFSVDRGLRFQSRLFVVRAAPAKPRIRTPQCVISFGQDSRPLRGGPDPGLEKLEFEAQSKTHEKLRHLQDIDYGRSWAKFPG